MKHGNEACIPYLYITHQFPCVLSCLFFSYQTKMHDCRNYYRCTSAGCPAQKHIDTAVDNTSAVIITYKGIHDHDMPVPKKWHGLPSAPLVAAASPASLSSSQGKKPDPSPTQKSPAQGPVDAEDLTGDALELGGEKAMESARTLLSIGFEIRPCWI